MSEFFGSVFVVAWLLSLLLLAFALVRPGLVGRFLPWVYRRPTRLRVAGLVALVSVALLITAGALLPGEESSSQTPSANQASPPPTSPSPHASTTAPAPLKPVPATPTPKPSKTKTTTPSGSGTPTRIVFVSVGQGDAVLVQSGSHEMLVDGGPGGTAGAVESAAGRAGIKDLDLVVVSHMHADHIGATDDLVYDYDPERALIAGSCDSALGSAFAASGTKVKQVRRGDSLTVGSVKVKVLSPAGISGDENEDSLVLLLEVAGKRILLAGDLTGPNEAAVGGITARGPPLYLLKVAHHGSRYSTSSTFLDDADPQFAVICVGPNSYGHPTPDTVSRLKAEGTRIYSTQKNGTITLTIAASGAVRWQFSKTSNPVTSAGGSSGGSSDGSVTTGGSSSGSSTVYITNTGECYHRSGCQYLSQSKIPISLKDVKAQGYRACSVCDPPQ